MPHDDLLLVGSVPLDTAEETFRALAPALGGSLPYLPDGEVAERAYWVDGFAYRVLNGHPDLETLKRPAPDEGGVERWKPRGIFDEFQFRVKADVKAVQFGDPGWRLGYTRDAVNSYFVFRTLKKEGVIPQHVKFQVCMPLSHSAVSSFFPDPADHDKIIPGVSRAFRTEIEKMVEKIPPGELVIQWDLAVENRFLEAKMEKEGLEAGKREAERLMAPAADICPYIPKEVELGYHSCFGTLNGWPSRQPSSLLGTVLLLNAGIAASGRKVEFVHFPTVRSIEESFFSPLADLKKGPRPYVGLIHHLVDAAGMKQQMALSKRYLGSFGIAAPCGFGRAPERPGALLSGKASSGEAMVKQIVADHLAALALLRG